MFYKTDRDRDAYESREGDNTYLWRVENNISPIVEEMPRGIESGFGYGSTLSLTPISIYNTWPEKVDNASIFQYLNQDREQDYPEFSGFIKDWYQSSCAIVYKNGLSNKIVGSGILIQKTCIATARHNFDNIPFNNLYVRFFHYEVTNSFNPQYLCVRERHLDIPVIEKSIANNGVDGGYLTIPFLQNTSVFNRYAKEIPADFNRFQSALPSGDYAMFHFSGGKPQVSVGKIHASSFGADLHANAFIQAGPGASGAGLIWKSFDSVSALGVSIYRFMNEGNIQRRIIRFPQFRYGVFSDGVSDPYRYNPSFMMIPVNAFNEDGYEFLRYRLEAYKGRRVEHSNHAEYPVKEHHSNHHIVPISDLLYLWDYFNTLDCQSELEVRRIVSAEVQERKWALQTSLQNEINQFYPHEREHHLRVGNARITERLNHFSEQRYRAVYGQRVTEKYYLFHMVFQSLSPNFQNNASAFAWSFWNLFKGWERSYRTDDPADGCTLDFSEKTRPASFSHALWTCIKDDNEGLYRRIQQLKATATPNAANRATMFHCLTALANEWGKRNQAARQIHKYRGSDWEPMGKKDGHDIYQVKPSY